MATDSIPILRGPIIVFLAIVPGSVKMYKIKACFIRRISVASNAIQTIDNET